MFSLLYVNYTKWKNKKLRDSDSVNLGGIWIASAITSSPVDSDDQSDWGALG